MNPRNTGLLFLLTAALFTLVWFFEIRGGEGRQAAAEAEKRLFSGIEPADIQTIGFTTSGGQKAVLERGAGDWQLVSPIHFAADTFTADGLAGALVDLASDSALEGAQDPAIYGLDDPGREVRFTAAGAAHALRLGNKTPVGANSYAKVVDAPEIYTVPTVQVNPFTKTLDDLREKRIVEFDTGAIEQIRARWPTGFEALEKRNGEWGLLEPVVGPADQQTVEDLLSDLSFLRATGFVDDPPQDGEVGLDPPAFAVELEAPAEGETEALRLRLLVGDTLDGKTRAVRAEGSVLYQIAAERIDDYPMIVGTYRFRQLADFAVLDAKRLEMRFGDPAETVELVATRDGSGWSAGPEGFQPGKLASLVSELSRLKARGILMDRATPEQLREFGLEPALVAYRAYGEPDESGKEALLADVRVGTLQGGEGIVAKAAGRDEIYQLEYELAEHIPVSLEAFRNRFARQPEQDASAEAPAAPEPTEAFEGLEALPALEGLATP